MSESDEVTVRIENTYACGRGSDAEERVVAPPINPSEEALEEWWTKHVEPLTGDGHSCGEREHSYYKAVITDAPGRPELVGQDMEWMDT